MEWWETPDAQYESYLAEGVAKKAIGAYAGYRVAKWLAPKVIKGGIDAYHKGRDFANQTAQRAQDPQSHNRPDDYRYPNQAEPKPNDRQVAKEDAWDGYTIDEFGMPVQEFDAMRARDTGTGQSGTLIAYGKNKTAWVSDRKAAKYGAGAAVAGAAAYGAYKGVKKLAGTLKARQNKVPATEPEEAKAENK